MVVPAPTLQQVVQVVQKLSLAGLQRLDLLPLRHHLIAQARLELYAEGGRIRRCMHECETDRLSYGPSMAKTLRALHPQAGASL